MHEYNLIKRRFSIFFTWFQLLVYHLQAIHNRDWMYRFCVHSRLVSLLANEKCANHRRQLFIFRANTNVCFFFLNPVWNVMGLKITHDRFSFILVLWSFFPPRYSIIGWTVCDAYNTTSYVSSYPVKNYYYISKQKTIILCFHWKHNADNILRSYSMKAGSNTFFS